MLKRSVKFLGCTGYPNCKFTINLSHENPIVCPSCGSPLTVRKGPYGTFLGCTGFSAIDCRYTYNLENGTSYLYSKKNDKKNKKKFNSEPVLNTEKILQAINSDLQDINKIAEKLTITDQLDIMYLKNKLKEFERKGDIIKILVDNQEFWKMG